MPISPQNLKDYIIAAKYDLNRLFDNIDKKLCDCDLSDSGIYQVWVDKIPMIVSELIIKQYVGVGWTTVEASIIKGTDVGDKDYTQLNFAV